MRWLILIAALGCQPSHPADEPGLPPIEPQPGAGCSEACARLRELACEMAQTTPGGLSCEKVCEETMAAGYPMHPECVVGARSCAEADRLSQGCGTSQRP